MSTPTLSVPALRLTAARMHMHTTWCATVLWVSKSLHDRLPAVPGAMPLRSSIGPGTLRRKRTWCEADARQRGGGCCVPCWHLRLPAKAPTSYSHGLRAESLRVSLSSTCRSALGSTVNQEGKAGAAWGGGCSQRYCTVRSFEGSPRLLWFDATTGAWRSDRPLVPSDTAKLRDFSWRRRRYHDHGEGCPLPCCSERTTSDPSMAGSLELVAPTSAQSGTKCG